MSPGGPSSLMHVGGTTRRFGIGWALPHYITNAQKFVPGFAIELAGTPEQCHGYYRFPWLIRLPDGSEMGRGTNFGQLAGTGRFLSAIDFWDKL